MSGAVFKLMGVSHFSVVFLLSGYTSLFICGSCKLRLQREVPHSYLCVKAPLAALGWYFLTCQANRLNIVSSLTFLFNWNCISRFNIYGNSRMRVVTNQKQMHVLILGLAQELFENYLVRGERLHGSGTLWLFVCVSL